MTAPSPGSSWRSAAAARAVARNLIDQVRPLVPASGLPSLERIE
jgi:hypothetical protein